MSNCYICDQHIDELQIDPRDNKTKPCGTCLNVIQENLAMISGRKGDDSDFDILSDVPILDADVLLEDEYDNSDVEDIMSSNQYGYHSGGDE